MTFDPFGDFETRGYLRNVATTAPRLVVSKGNDRAKISFAYPKDIRRAIDYGLNHGQDKKFMAAKPGEIMGYLAHGHPFLDGNGRTIMALHCVLAQRAGFSIDWAETSKNDYLAALTKELEDPHKGYLDDYLKPFIASAVPRGEIAANIAAAPGIDGEGEDTVLGTTDDSELNAQYEAQELKRRQQ